ncbi:UNVERIFIED_CONTAM: Brefeldin A-inhibited guanine nucleotide-exchange protein 1 [Sesamum angustifolium]|uniref:Brefeldin A-inhibited guanine nucleotide-exchange protein 1 n=1 Tax=Sesamum angustifolium TaxID=2727405 RepID=A0AAW2KDU7_9LAMI
MSTSQTLGGASRCGWVLGPSLDKIIKNVAWRKHSHLVSACKSVLDKLESLTDDASDPGSCSPLYGLSSSDADFLLQPLIMALESRSPKVVEPALDCAFRLFSFGIIRGCEIQESSSLIYRLVDTVCKCSALGDEAIELAVLEVLLSAVRSPSVYIRGDCLVYIVKTCYNIYLGGKSGTLQICAKSVLAQMMIIVFTRVEQNSMLAEFKNVVVFELLEFADRNLNEGSSIHFSQNFINEIVDAKQSPPDSKHSSDERKNQSVNVSRFSGQSDLREDGFTLYKNLCKLSMKFSSQEHSDDRILSRGKVLSLELLNVIMGNAGPVWHTNERFLNVLKQYLCLSLMKNSAVSVMTIFQLLCSIFFNLVSKFRSGLKSEIATFFPMLIIRVLENVLQPSFLQKMTVLSLVEKISQDPQIVIDIFVNYDCDVEAPNLYERIVNGLLKTALGPPPGSTTSLSPAQDTTVRHESVKCLVIIIKSLGTWMDQQLKVERANPPKISNDENLTENMNLSEDAKFSDCELPSEAKSEFTDAATLEQRRAYKLEIQKGIALFNSKPSKGIEFLISTKRVGSSPEEVAFFLKSTSGLNKSMMGDYFGEREEFPMKVMHAYVDSFNFDKMGFGEAFRSLLRGFSLHGEAEKIDRIMEKFAERYCKCNPSSFSSADTAYALAYSVVVLNMDAHYSMVKNKMTKADFIRNNRGIDDGKDLPEDYLGTLYDDIMNNEIKMSTESSALQSKQGNSLNELLGLDGIFNLVPKQTEEKPLGPNEYLIRHIQEQCKEKSLKPDLLGPDACCIQRNSGQTDDKEATTQCLQGFRYAVHVTAGIGMQTQRDAFVTTVAKFTYLHCAADMKQKNVDAVKAIISIAIEDGNYLQEAWEHILTCLSRFEQLQLLGEGALSEASSLNTPNSDTELKSSNYPSLKKKEALQNPAVVAVVLGGSYDSTSRVYSSGLVTPEQMNNFMSNLHLLDQIGNFELNHIFAHSQRLNNEAIVPFVKALCKVSMLELQSPTDPRVFSLTKMVEVAHYNMNRIRIVWSRIWSVLSEFLIAVGLSENLSIAILVMDMLRQLTMKYLEREELTNYNFQSEFLRPFVVVIEKSTSTEIRELIVRCISQMVFGRFSNIRSGWKSVFMVFTAAAADERKSTVLMAFEAMEKIVREYFSYITETETLTFTHCVRCLITFANNRFNSDVSLNAIAFVRFCAVKLADGGLAWNEKSEGDSLNTPPVKDNALGGQKCMDKDDHTHFWVPLLSGLSRLTSDPRPPIRRCALEVLFNILKDHGHLFPQPFWANVFDSAIFPLFSFTCNIEEPEKDDDRYSPDPGSQLPDESIWESETNAVPVECLSDLFVNFFDLVRPQLRQVVSILVRFIKSPAQGPSSAGMAALIRSAAELRGKLSAEEWLDIFLCLEEAAKSSLTGLTELLKSMNSIEVPDFAYQNDVVDDFEDDNLQTMAYIVSRMKSHIAVQLLIMQVVADLCKMHVQSLSLDTFTVIREIFLSTANHSSELKSETSLLLKLEKTCSLLEMSEPPLIHFENECYQNYLNFLHDLLMTNPSMSQENNIEAELVSVCEEVLQIYLDCAGFGRKAIREQMGQGGSTLPSGSVKEEELAARTPLVLSMMRILGSLERGCFRRYVSQLFPSLVDLVRSEHSSWEVQDVLSNILESCIGPLIME